MPIPALLLSSLLLSSLLPGSGVPDIATIRGDVRTVPGMNRHTVRADLDVLIARVGIEMCQDTHGTAQYVHRQCVLRQRPQQVFERWRQLPGGTEPLLELTELRGRLDGSSRARVGVSVSFR